jgi:hypothetical protein
MDEDPDVFPSVLYPRIQEPNPRITRVTTGFRRPSDLAVSTKPDVIMIQPRMPLPDFKKKYSYIEPGASCQDQGTITLYGTSLLQAY